jgi:hypothetical protein
MSRNICCAAQFSLVELGRSPSFANEKQQINRSDNSGVNPTAAEVGCRTTKHQALRRGLERATNRTDYRAAQLANVVFSNSGMSLKEPPAE